MPCFCRWNMPKFHASVFCIWHRHRPIGFTYVGGPFLCCPHASFMLMDRDTSGITDAGTGFSMMLILLACYCAEGRELLGNAVFARTPVLFDMCQYSWWSIFGPVDNNLLKSTHPRTKSWKCYHLLDPPFLACSPCCFRRPPNGMSSRVTQHCWRGFCKLQQRSK